ncbi:MAG TPA: hypothetical protein DGT21_13650 [Armatimonadetes bacterium]|nr:hypothetical protein [Armatimonadota bacterium]
MHKVTHTDRPDAVAETRHPLRLRTLVLAVLIGVVGIRLLVYSSLVRLGAGIDWGFAVLVVLVLLEPLVERVLKLGKRDFLYIYVFCVVSTGVFDGVSRFLPVYTAAQYFNAPDNNYSQIADLYPSWFIPHDEELMRQFYEGATGPVDMTPWLLPLAMWTVFFAVVWFTLLCICTILRRHWVDDERLAFPLVTVPLYVASLTPERIRPKKTIWHEPLMWVGFTITTIHFVSIMVHAANPAIPTLGPGYDLGKFFTDKPWDGLKPYFLFVHNPALVGLAYFAPQDLCFSMFFFFFMIKGVMLFYRFVGLQNPSGFPFFWEQAAGAFVAIAIYYAWAGREYYAKVWRSVLGGWEAAGAAPRDHESPFSYRFAAVGALLGFVFLCAWYVAAGMTWWIPIVFFALIILFATVFTRGRAESGVASTASSPFWQASRQIKSFLGTRAITPGNNYTNVAMLGSLIFLHFSSYPQTMTYQAEGLKLSSDAKMNNRHMTALMALAVIVGIVVTMWAIVGAHYQWGGITLGTATGVSGGYGVSITLAELREVSSVIDGNHLPRDWNRNGFTLGAFALTLILVFVRTRWLRFPLHPLGYVMTTPYGYAYWGPFLTSWAVKWVLLRLGGMRLYNALVPLFIGLVVGQIFSISVVWQIVSLFMTEEWRGLADPLSYF